jgi:hypothetical protein
MVGGKSGMYFRFEEHMEAIEEPESVEEVQVDPFIWAEIEREIRSREHWKSVFEQSMERKYGARTIYNLHGVDIPLVKNDTLVGWKTITKESRQRKGAGFNMTQIELTDVRINGVVFEDMMAVLRIDQGEPIMEIGEQFPYHRVQEHRVHLYPNTSKDVALIMYGLCTALKTNDPGQEITRITITGVDKHKPWATYEVEGCWLSAYQMMDARFNGNNKNRVEEATFEVRNGYKIHIDEDRKPKLQPLVSEEEMSLAIVSLIKSKDSFDPGQKKTADRLITHLQKTLAGRK